MPMEAEGDLGIFKTGMEIHGSSRGSKKAL